MKNFALVFFSLFIVINASSCESNNNAKDSWEWDNNKKNVVNKTLSLQWNLSEFEWIVADKDVMPDNMTFCAKCPEGVVLSILELPKTDEVYDVWKESSQFIKGFISNISSQGSIFPGIKYEDVKSEKCHFLFKKALKFSVINEIKDARIDTGSMTMIDAGYLFVKDRIPIILMLMMPYEYVIEGGEEVINYFFKFFSYINASAEVKN